MSAHASEEYRHGYDRGREYAIAEVKTVLNRIIQEHIEKYGADIIELYDDVVTEFKEWLEEF